MRLASTAMRSPSTKSAAMHDTTMRSKTEPLFAEGFNDFCNNIIKLRTNRLWVASIDLIGNLCRKRLQKANNLRQSGSRVRSRHIKHQAEPQVGNAPAVGGIEADEEARYPESNASLLSSTYPA